MHGKTTYGWKIFIIIIAAALSSMPLSGTADAATYYSMTTGKEICTSILFGQDGGGEYTLTAEDPGVSEGKPWVDNHFTSFVASSENLVSVPICFSSIGRKLADEGNVVITIKTPTGTVNHEYGVCVAKYEDVDITAGPAEGSPCEVMGSNTDVFSAGLDQPELYAQPGETVSYSIILDSSTPMTVSIAKSSGDISLMTTESSVVLGSGPESITLNVLSPDSPGDYHFSVLATVDDCNIDDCTREVDGILHVTASVSEEPQASFYVWLTPETKSIMGQKATEFNMKVQNYGEGQEITAVVTTGDGLETDFAPYTTFVKKGESKSIPFNVRPSVAESSTYKLTVSVQGADGTRRSASSWLTVDEMVADASKMGQDYFIESYDPEEVTLGDWEELRSVTGSVTYDDDIDFDATTEAPNYMIYIIIAVVAVVAGVLVFIVYKKGSSQSSEGPTWGDLGLKS